MQLIESGLIHYYVEKGQLTRVDRSVTAQTTDSITPTKTRGLMMSHHSLTEGNDNRPTSGRNKRKQHD